MCGLFIITKAIDHGLKTIDCHFRSSKGRIRPNGEEGGNLDLFKVTNCDLRDDRRQSQNAPTQNLFSAKLKTWFKISLGVCPCVESFDMAQDRLGRSRNVRINLRIF